MMCFISKYDDSVDDVGCLLALGTEMLRSMLRSIIGIVFSILFYNCTFFSHNVLISILKHEMTIEVGTQLQYYLSLWNTTDIWLWTEQKYIFCLKF